MLDRSLLTDDHKNELVQYDYDVFGAVQNRARSTNSPRRFTRKESDANVKLYCYCARCHDCCLGRFTLRNPITDGINWYVYTENNLPRITADDSCLQADGLCVSLMT